LTVDGCPGSEAVPEEVKLRIRIFALASSVLAVDDLGFVRMHFQLAFRQTGRQRRFHSNGFGLRPAVHQPVVCIPAPWEVWMLARHPRIERVMHEQIRQHGAADALNAKDNFCFDRRITDWRSRSVLDLRRK
jgi:hypothetical protein